MSTSIKTCYYFSSLTQGVTGRGYIFMNTLQHRKSRLTPPAGEPEEPDEDNMEEIDMDNIVSSRTRGKNIDYAEAAKNLEEDDDDDEEDDDFQDEEMED